MTDNMENIQSHPEDAQLPDSKTDVNNDHASTIHPYLNKINFKDLLLHSYQYPEDDSDDENDIVTLTDVNRGSKIQPQLRSTPSLNSHHPLDPSQVNPSTGNMFVNASKLKNGEVSPPGLALCPFNLVTSYPYKYVGKANQDKVAAFFKANVLDDRAWDILSNVVLLITVVPVLTGNRFYIHDPHFRRDPLILVPSEQFEQFLDLTNLKLLTKLCIPGGFPNETFYVTFAEYPYPRFMGQVSDGNAFQTMKGRLGSHVQEDWSKLDAKSAQRFKDKMDGIYYSFKPAKAKKNPELQRLKQMFKQKDWGRIMKRVQRYLGLRQRNAFKILGEASDATAWNVNLAVPFRLESSVKFVCVDVEAYERSSNTITEIGLAILDTGDIEGIPPGENGENWFEHAIVHHLRIDEYRSIVNKDFVRGCPDAFHFGSSEFVSIKDAARRIGSIIGDTTSSDKRPIVMVGHDSIVDLKYLKKVGYNLWRLPQFMDEIDTKAMFQRVQFGLHGRSLQYVCNELGMPGHDYHNAGNDAVYTLRAMIAMAVKKKVGGPQTESQILQPQAQSATKVEEWSDGEQDDGGSAVKSKEPVDVQCPAQPRIDPHAYQRW
ncbi:hypothetical protein BJ170DRAFT_732548 [Xylariales sp. AK1849]|nr:hypothetical protein BJ170DRAFT_732548 [Xylariales sp. AK1849]